MWITKGKRNAPEQEVAASSHDHHIVVECILQDLSLIQCDESSEGPFVPFIDTGLLLVILLRKLPPCLARLPNVLKDPFPVHIVIVKEIGHSVPDVSPAASIPP